MDLARTQVLIWFLLPIAALVLVVLLAGFQLMIVPPIVALLALAFTGYWYLNRKATEE